VPWYSTLATNDAAAVLTGQLFDNLGRWYSGSLDEQRLSALLAALGPDQQVLDLDGK